MRSCAALRPILLLALLAGCSPTLSGAACLTDCNCPSAQRCLRNPDGGNGVCDDGANYCGKDAGPALFGTLTLNGGVQKPSGNAASVVAWDHNPTVFPDGGFETPLFTTNVNDDGTWELEQGASGATYYLTGIYALNAGRASWSLPEPETANGFSIDVDVPTYVCLVWSEFGPTSAMPLPFLAGLVADVPDITDGTELSTATVKASDGTRPFTLKLTPHPEDPFASGKWAWGPLVPGDTPAVSGTYTFSISATGYDSATKCSVNSTLLNTVPTASMVPNPWDTTNDQTIVFTPPREAQATFIFIVDMSGNPVAIPPQLTEIFHGTGGAPVSVTFPRNTLGSSICPENGKQCTLILLSVRQTFTGNTGVDEATASSSSFFNMTSN
jgi:hypothetical protein